MALQLIVRAADVSNCCKPFGVSKQWFNRLTAEFFQQGKGDCSCCSFLCSDVGLVLLYLLSLSVCAVLSPLAYFMVAFVPVGPLSLP